MTAALVHLKELIVGVLLVGRGGISRQRWKVHGKKDFASGGSPPDQLMAKKILDLDLNPKSFLSVGGRQRGGRAKGFLARLRVGRLDRQNDFVSGGRPP